MERNENTPNQHSELMRILGVLSVDQVRFVVARQETKSDKAAAEIIGVSAQTIKHWKYDGVPINQAVQLMALDGIAVAREIRRRSLAKAMLVKRAGLDSGDERLRQGVATEIIEWEMGKATQRQEHSGPGGEPLVVKFVSNVEDADL